MPDDEGDEPWALRACSTVKARAAQSMQTSAPWDGPEFDVFAPASATFQQDLPHARTGNQYTPQERYLFHTNILCVTDPRCAAAGAPCKTFVPNASGK